MSPLRDPQRIETFVPLEGHAVLDAGPNRDQRGFLLTRNGKDIVTFTEEELRQMLTFVENLP